MHQYFDLLGYSEKYQMLQLLLLFLLFKKGPPISYIFLLKFSCFQFIILFAQISFPIIQIMYTDSLSILQRKLIILAKDSQQRLKQKDEQNFDRNSSEQEQKAIRDCSLTISYTILQKMPIKIKKVIQENFQKLIQLSITNCDLRTFENFPKLANLTNLNVSKNSLRGSFEFLVKNRTIKYINLSNNMINQVKKFEPLRCLKNVSIYAKQNPFLSKSNVGGLGETKNYIRQQLKNLGIKLLDKPLQLKKQEKREVKLENFQSISNNPQTNKKYQLFSSEVRTKKLKILQKLIKKTTGESKNIDESIYQSFIANHQQRILFNNSFSSRQAEHQAATFSKIYNHKKENGHSKASKMSSNFYQIIHTSQPLRVDSSDSQVESEKKQQENGHQQNGIDDSFSQDEDIPQNLQWKQDNHFLIELAYDEQELRIQNGNNEQNNDEDENGVEQQEGNQESIDEELDEID